MSLIVCVLIALGSAFSADAGSPSAWDQAARSRKTDYIYLDALRFNSQQGCAEDVYMLLHRAASLSPEDVQVGAELGFYETAIAADTSMYARGMERLRRKFLTNPSDYFWSSLYANQLRQAGNLRERVRVEGVLDSIYPEKTELSLRYAEDLGHLAVQGDSSALDRSMSVFDRVERATGKDPWVVSRRVMVLSALQDTAAVYREVGLMLEENPHNSGSNLLAGTVFAFYEQPDSAIRYFDLACELDSANTQAYVTRAEYYRERADSAAYDREVFNILRLGTIDVDTKTDMLTNYVRELYTDTTPAQQQRINDLFSILMEQHPHEAQIHYLYGSYLAVMDRFKEAAEQFRYATDLQPTNYGAWSMLLSSCGQAEDYEGIIEAAERAREFFPDNTWWSLMEALAYSNLDRHTDAVEALDKELVKESLPAAERSKILSTKGDILYAADSVDASFACYEEAIELDPTNVNALNNAAYHLSEIGRDLEKAEIWASYAVTMEPENPTYLDTYAWVFFKKKDYEKAKEYIDRALEAEDPAELSKDILSHAGDIYHFCQLHDEAVDFWTKALVLDPDDELLARKVAGKTYYNK